MTSGRSRFDKWNKEFIEKLSQSGNVSESSQAASSADMYF